MYVYHSVCLCIIVFFFLFIYDILVEAFEENKFVKFSNYRETLLVKQVLERCTCMAKALIKIILKLSNTSNFQLIKVGQKGSYNWETCTLKDMGQKGFNYFIYCKLWLLQGWFSLCRA